MRAALRKEELAIFDRDIIAALLTKDKKKVAEVMVEKGIWDSDEEAQRKIAAMSALGRMVSSEQGKTVEEKVEEFMRDATVVWVDKGVQFKIQEYDRSEFIRFREDSHYWRA
jgi:predicted unusual protein kinase regulating ubiquinone biosynthesis (AarF/ABC1/UbiB family)